MRMYQDERRLDFHALGREIKRKREAKGWTQEYLAQLVDRTPRSIMYFENRGQHPSLNTFYQMVTMFGISVDEYFYPDMGADEAAKKALYTGEYGDGKIFLYDVENVVRIRTNETGIAALDNDVAH